MSAPPDAGLERGAGAAALGTALSRITGFVRLAALVYVIGVAESRLTDTYTLANTTPNILYELVMGGALSAIVLRVFIEVRERDGEEEAWRFISRLTNLSLLILGSIALVGVIASPLVMRAYTFRAPEAVRQAQQTIGSLLLAMFVPQIIFYGLNTIATAVLRAQRRFGVITFAPVVNNLAVTATFIGFALLIPAGDRNLSDIPIAGIILLGLGTTSGVALLGLVPWIYSRKAGRRRIKHAGLRDPRMRRVLRLYAYTLGYVAINQAGLWVTLILANQIRGAVAAREAAFTLFQLPHGLLAVSISFVTGTPLTERAVAGDMESFADALGRGLRGISFVILPAVAGYIAIGPELVRLLLEHGLVGSRSTDLISALLRSYAVGLLFFSSWHLIYTAFQGLGDTKTPMLINLGAFAIQVVVMTAIFFSAGSTEMRVAGLALGHAASYLVAAGVGLGLLRSRAGVTLRGPLMQTLSKALAGSLFVGVAARLVASGIESQLDTTKLQNQLLQILLSVGVGLLIYWAISRILRMEEVGWVKAVVSRR